MLKGITLINIMFKSLLGELSELGLLLFWNNSKFVVSRKLFTPVITVVILLTANKVFPHL